MVTYIPDDFRDNEYLLSSRVYDFFVTYDSLGCSSESNHLIVTVNPTPGVFSFSRADSACIGDVITLNGSGLTNVSAISFNGTPATSFAIVDDFTITVTVPVGATTGALSLAQFYRLYRCESGIHDQGGLWIYTDLESIS
ncbi:MAG: hypothetical protein IPO49_15930 [Bacteroidetes bacterium]|nr:hypothetical protein [Bacteroidota bacterium]